MWGELPENKHNEAEQNERVYESEMPTFTSDVRMAKIEEIFATGKGRGGKEECRGSGGGGPVEAVWWYVCHILYPLFNQLGTSY